MSDWFHRMMAYICQRFGRPSIAEMTEMTGDLDEKIEQYDHRLTKVERDLGEQEARVRLLEYQANPRGTTRGC